MSESIFPFISSGGTDAEEEALPLFQEYAYDPVSNRLLLDGSGKPYLVSGNAALRIWINKALRTARSRYVAYDDAYGSELDTLMGTTGSADVAELEVKRMITEALMVCPYILQLSDFQFYRSGGYLEVTFKATTIYGEETINEEVTWSP